MHRILSKIPQNIDRNKTGKFGLCTCYWHGDFRLSAGE